MKKFLFEKAGRWKIGPYILVMSILLFGMVACAPSTPPKDPFAYTAYTGLSTGLESYKVIKNTFTDLRAQGLVKDETWAEFDRLANIFVDKHKEASKAMADYKRGLGPQTAADLAVKALETALEELKKYYRDKIPPEQQNPLF
jgi:hypothetical protein